MRFASLVLALSIATSALGDGTVTTPGNIAPVSWKIGQMHVINGADLDVAGVSITIYYFDAGGTRVNTALIALTGAEIVSLYTTTNSAVAGESGSSVKRARQRLTKWLIDNGKITNVTPE